MHFRKIPSSVWDEDWLCRVRRPPGRWSRREKEKEGLESGNGEEEDSGCRMGWHRWPKLNTKRRTGEQAGRAECLSPVSTSAGVPAWGRE